MNKPITFLLTVISFAGMTSFSATAQDQDELLKRGEYLINGPVACANCHTPRNPDMSFQTGMDYALKNLRLCSPQPFSLCITGARARTFLP